MKKWSAYSALAKNQQAELLGAPLIAQPTRPSAEQVTIVTQCVMQCVTVSSSSVTDCKKVHVFFWKKHDIFAKLYEPFELTLLPEEVVLLLVLVLFFPPLSLLQVMGQ